jgi:hypothetical protein
MQATDDMHDTAPRELVNAPLRFGVGRIVQTLPFHDSDNVTVARLDESLSNCPTAMQAVDEAQDTPSSEGARPDEGSAACRIVQRLPFHDSAKVCELKKTSNLPTAVQAVDDVQATASRELDESAGLGTEMSLQLFPFHDSDNKPSWLGASASA